MVRNKKLSLTKQEREEQRVGKKGCKPWKAGRGWTGEQGTTKGWVGQRDEVQEMLPGGKRYRTQPTSFLTLSSEVPNLNIPMLQEIVAKMHLLTRAQTLLACLPQSLRCRGGGLGFGSNRMSPADEPSLGQNENCILGLANDF